MSDENTEQTDKPTQKVINLNINDARIAKAKEAFKDIDAYVDIDAAKKAKKVLIKMRTTLTEAHKREKAQILIDGRRLDGEKNRLLVLIAEVEDPISDQLTEIKEKAEREEAARVEKIEAEIERIKAFANDRHDLTVEQLEERRTTLATIEITEEFFEELTEQAQTFKDEADAKLRIALINEKERVAEAEKLEAQRKEQEERQATLDKQQADIDAQKATQEAEQAERDKTAREEQEKENARRKSLLDKQAKALEEEEARLDDENARIAQEATDKEEAERKAREQAEAAELAALQAPDIEKLDKLAEQIEAIAMPTVASQAAEDILTYVRSDIRELAKNIRHYAGEMK